MKKILKVVSITIGVIILCLIIDLISIFVFNKPIFAIRKDNMYSGLLYNTYICPEYSIPQVTAKTTKLTCSEKVTFEIIDETENCDEALEEIFKDDDYVYYLNCIKSNNITIKFSNGNNYKLKEVLKNGILTIEELINNGLDIIKYSTDENVTFLLDRYTPLMSSTPGYPIKFIVDDEVDTIDISVKNGTIITWNHDSQVVTSDNNYSIGENTILYFDVNEHTTININLKRDDLLIDAKQIYFPFIDNYYYAKLK